jgi:SAM-dependent methyltransferase
MIENLDTKETEVSEFYDGLAPDYDRMVGFDDRFVKERPFLHLLIEQYRVHEALDAGCGTGFHSLLLARLGVEMTAVDLSQAMLQRLRARAERMGLNIKTVHAAFCDLPNPLKKEFDAVFCLGNTLSHFRDKKELVENLRAFSLVLKPQGILLIQILNYDRILARRERIQNVKERDNTTFVRFYDFGRDRLCFNVLKLTRHQGRISPTLRSIELTPLPKKELLETLEETGFVDPRVYGGISMEPFQHMTSKDLVVLAAKPDK